MRNSTRLAAIAVSLCLATPCTAQAKRGFLSDDVLLGPVLQVAFPHYVNYGLEILYKGEYSAGGTRGSLSLGVDKFGIALSNSEVRLRHSPGNRWFFYGLNAGRQSASVDVGHEVDILSTKFAVPIKLDYDVRSSYLTPLVGLGYTHRSGLHVGMDVGWQITSLRSDDLTLQVLDEEKRAEIEGDELYTALIRRMRKAGHFYGSANLPHMTLARVGWWF